MSNTRNTGFLTNIIQYTPSGNISFVSGSTTLMSISSSGAITTTGVISGSTALSASNALSSSYSLVATTATTASSISNLNQNVAITGSLTTTGQIVAQTLNVQQVTSSIVYSSGSNIFGNSQSNTQQFTGSMLVTGSTTIGTAGTNYTLLQNGNLSRISGSSYGALVYDGLNHTFRYDNLSTGLATGLTIVSGSGNVGIGTTSIANGTAFGGGGQVNRLKVASGNYTCLEVNGSTSGGSLQFTYGTDLPNQVGALVAYNYAAGGDLGMYISNVTNGIIAFSTNNTERMRISASGNVGIGTNNPSHELSVVDSSFNQYSLRLESQSGNTLNRWGGIGFAGEGSNTKAAILFVSEGGSYSRGNLVFANNSDFNQNSATPSDARMIITKEGYVTTPSQPFASVGLTTDFSSVGNTIVWQQAHYNVGSRYNTSTGIFTCPVAGTYLVSIMCMTAGIDQTLDIELRINGATSNVLVPYQSTNGGIYNQVSGMAMLALQANDTLAFRLNSGSVYGTSAGRHSAVVFALVG